MTDKIKVFYTGGGITIAETGLDKKRYAVVSTEAPEFLTVYFYTDDYEACLPENMISSTPKDELPPELKSLHAKMVAKLKTS